MDTTTVLVVIGCGVLVKTLAFVGFVVRRDRRQRRELVVAQTAAEAAAQTAVEAAAGLVASGGHLDRTTAADRDPAWRLQWAEPGVLLVEYAHGEEPARGVHLTATLTTGCGLTATLSHDERFVGTGACFLAPFADLVPWLDDAATTLMTGGAQADQADLGCDLSYVLGWHTEDGVSRQQVVSGEQVVPVPDLALQQA